ncbi:selenide, water dikinase [Acetohalobium arabaticum DSM 5501]|uniref:Selenide, water dikinase n=1 Tax=Acetohalobium arabaticum (strain ATCC 49924 / DSM 5501 / Z-7288) TaxID=574087 RepID=D9QUA3_ACEAZ|nr:selenide, water dikinase [Acetohalobium arabaticum DSM 5501]
MRSVPTVTNERELVGLSTSDDASVIKLNEKQALIQSLDFFTPVVEDPYLFGQIAAANALSDIYAMGGEPLSAMNIVGFPPELDTEILEKILQGGADKVKEAGAILAGGHTIEDEETKYGLSASGLVAPADMVSNAGAEPGDKLVLTKPLGIGIAVTAINGGLSPGGENSPAIQEMLTLNKDAAEVMQKIGVNAATDVTGFGLLGHLWELVSASGVQAVVNFSTIPLLSEVIEWAEMGLVPGGAYSNQEYINEHIDFTAGFEEAKQNVLFDPQTSGGLLISVTADKADKLEIALQKKGVTSAIIGRIESGEAAIKVKE